MNEESIHGRSTGTCDPGGCKSVYMLDQDLAAMREKFPFLRSFSDMLVRTTPPESLLKVRESERNRDADDKLASKTGQHLACLRKPSELVRTTGGTYCTRAVSCRGLVAQQPSSG